jgi:hypothetical protein
VWVRLESTRWLFLEYQQIGIHLDSSEWKLYPTCRTTPRQRNGYDCGVFSILFALHIGLRLNINNISQTQIRAIRCQMLLHLLKITPAEDDNQVFPVFPAIQETNANNPLLLSTSDTPRICLLTLESISKTNELGTKETKREK